MSKFDKLWESFDATFKQIEKVFETVGEVFNEEKTAHSKTTKTKPRLEVDRYRIVGYAGTSIEDRGFGRWAVVQGSFVLNKTGEWEREPLPSQRTPEFIIRTRYETVEEAFEQWKKLPD